MPKVSVVIPAYNAEHTLPETLASALDQTYRDFEVVVVDDGSTDDTAGVARGVGDDRVRVISVANGGVARARNTGIREASGEFITFLDADDLWRPTKLERQIELLHGEAGVGVSVTGATRIDSGSRPVIRRPAWSAEGLVVRRMLGAALDDYCEALLLNSMVAGCISSGMVRRSTVEQVGGFDPSFSQAADWDYWLRLSRMTRFGVLDDEMVLYRVHLGNMSRDIALLERETFAVLDKFFADPASERYMSLRPRAYSNHWMICSGSYLHAGQIGSSLRCLALGLRAYPAAIRQPLGLPARWIRRRTTHTP